MMASDHDSSGLDGTLNTDAGVNDSRRNVDDRDVDGSDFDDSESEVKAPMMQRSFPTTTTEKSTTLTTATAGGRGSYLAVDTSWKTDKYTYAGTLSKSDRLTSKQPSPTGMMAWVGFGCCLFALACLSISFCSPYWLQTWPLSENAFQSIGLWQACFHNYMHFKDDSQEVYSECWSLMDRRPKYYKLRDWLMPPWFITCQILTTGCLVFEISTVIILSLVFLHFCPLLNHEYLQSYGVFIAASIMFLVTMISFVTAILFGVQMNDRFWLPRPDQNFLSWGFGFLIISAIFALFAGICLFQEGWRAYESLLRKEDEHTKSAIQMTLYPPSEPMLSDDATTTIVAPGTSRMAQLELMPPPRYSHDSGRRDDSLVKPPLTSITISSSSRLPSSDDVGDSGIRSSTQWPPPPSQSLLDQPVFGAAAVPASKFGTVSGRPDVYEPQRFRQPTDFGGGKSFAKSFDRHYSDVSFDDPEMETFVPKVERQY